MEMNLKDTLLTRKKAIIAASCLVLIVAGSVVFFGFSAKKTEPEQPPRVRSTTIKLNNADLAAIYSGEVRGRFERALAFQVSGKITAVTWNWEARCRPAMF